ncbi:hypothetical protein VP424E501_P0123 [Vibrio phage 424E50-1]|nr:hypothetical protein VP424E501_P0123 [Vibrio phage 424E50-1]
MVLVMVTETRKTIVKSICSHNNKKNFNYTMYDFMDNEFDLHVDLTKGYDLDPEAEPLTCHMIEDQTGVVVKLTANTFLGTKVEIIEDPNNILGEDWEVGGCPEIYDSLSPNNPCRNK